MSYNTRRGIAFNKNISSSSVGQRRPIATNNYVQQTPQRQQPFQPSAQQQLGKQQQMLVQKKQEVAQQQRQLQQKQQMVQQKQQLANKQQLDNLSQQKRELDLKRQRDLEIQKQKELEQQKLNELKQQRNQIKLEQQQVEIVELELPPKNVGEVKQEHMHQIHTELDIPVKAEAAVLEVENQQPIGPVLNENESIQNVSGNKPEKKKWGAGRKLSKFELRRRRNLRLSKLLQPKNATVVLNDIVNNVTYSVDDCPNKDTSLYRAIAVVYDVEYEGFGSSKNCAKNNAAEKALKYLVKHKKLIQFPKTTVNSSNQGDAEPMDTSETEEKDVPLAWQQFASFAVYKLLASWGEDPNSIREVVNNKPSKKLPDNAQLMHPLVLLNQMIPHVRFEEMSQSMNGHSFTYTYKCTVDGQTFVGTGTSKKTAKKLAAFAVCRSILGVEYPPDLYVPPVPPTSV